MLCFCVYCQKLSRLSPDIPHKNSSYSDMKQKYQDFTSTVTKNNQTLRHCVYTKLTSYINNTNSITLAFDWLYWQPPVRRMETFLQASNLIIFLSMATTNQKKDLALLAKHNDNCNVCKHEWKHRSPVTTGPPCIKQAHSFIEFLSQLSFPLDQLLQISHTCRYITVWLHFQHKRCFTCFDCPLLFGSSTKLMWCNTKILTT